MMTPGGMKMVYGMLVYLCCIFAVFGLATFAFVVCAVGIVIEQGAVLLGRSVRKASRRILQDVAEANRSTHFGATPGLDIAQPVSIGHFPQRFSD
jgi:hypothetical protein